ncbi:MAG: S41 family peptidase [Candidatus Krumholzibacteria bacterium]|nr:S41 family peptidase [Candidatus Krumholzibacteria bacterium]
MCVKRSFGFLVSVLVLAALAVGALVLGASAQLPGMGRGDLPAIDAKVQAAVIDSITAALKEGYIFADKAARMDSLLRANLAAGAYRTLTDPAEFMDRLQADVAKIYLDKHMQMAAMPPGRIRIRTSEDPGPCGADEQREMLRRDNYGFRKTELLAGNVGYVKFNNFVDTDLAGPTAAAAMAFVANTDALIIDLRENGGGNASMIKLLAGYFFERSVHLIDWYHRRENVTIQSWSDDWVPGKRMPDVPVYILVSGFTGSAAEEFTYDLQNEKRATVVGETTAGAAHTIEFLTFDVGPFSAGLRLPSGRAISPVTNTNWEVVGVRPDIAVPADKALAAAHLDALKKLEENTEDAVAKAALAWARTAVESEIEAYTPTVKELKEYVGIFGPRTFFMEGSKLIYERQGRPRGTLVPMGKDLFALQEVGYFRVRFTRNASGAIDGVVGMYDNGQEERNPKGK